MVAEPRASDAAPSGAQDGGWAEEHGRVCWTVGEIGEQADSIVGREVAVIGYLHERASAVPELTDSRGETALRLPVVGSFPKCDGLVKVRGVIVRDDKNYLQGPSFVGQDDGAPILLLGASTSCTQRDDCVGLGDQEDGGRAPCNAEKYRGSLSGAVSLTELKASPGRYADREVVVVGVLSSRRTLTPSLRFTEQRGGSFIDAEVALQTMDRTVRRQLRACDGARLIARGRVHVVGLGSAPRMHVLTVGVP